LLALDSIVPEGVEGPHNDVEESSRESLINKIIKWSKMDDAEEVLSEVCELAALLEKYRTMNVLPVNNSNLL
jgi:hypothetical protein